MKRFILFARLYTSLGFLVPPALSAQEVPQYPNYVVIGAFAHHKNAIAFTGDANKNKFPARFEMNPNRNLYYVYVLTTGDRELAIAEAVRLRAETKYFDTWVYSGALGDLVLAIPGGQPDHDVDPLTGEKIQSVNSHEERPGTSTRSGNGNLSEERPGTSTRSNNGHLSEERRGTSTRSDNGNLSEERPGTSTRSNNGNLSEERPAGEAVWEGNLQKTGTAERADSALSEAGQGGTEKANIISSKNIGSGKKNSTGNVERSTLPGQLPQDDSGAVHQGGDRSSELTPENPLSEKIESANAEQNSTAPGSGNRNEDVGAQGRRQRKGKTGEAGNVSSEKSESADAQKRAGNTSQGISDGGEEPTTESKVAAGLKTDVGSNLDASVMLGPPPTRATTEPLQSEEVEGKNFYFYIFRADNGNMIAGEVDAIDFERARRMATYPGNKAVTVRMPSGKTKQVSFLCQVFGYRKQQKEFDPNSPAEDLYLDDKGNLVVPFELVRLQKGDIAIMYNVFFFKDAAVMRPESRYEVNNLLELLTENPSYNIRIHGHTNGNANGKIIRMDTPGNFYSLTGTKQGFGSARKLSEERANVIRDFLISSGISADRMQVKAWGGKKPIHDTRSVRAHENVRVEIEILSK